MLRESFLIQLFCQFTIYSRNHITFLCGTQGKTIDSWFSLEVHQLWPKPDWTSYDPNNFPTLPFHIIAASSLPTFTILPAYIKYNSVQAYLRGPVGLHVYNTTVGFQQTSLPWLSDLTVGVQLSAYMQSFTAPFQLYSADWLCLHAAVPEGSPGQTKTEYSDPDFHIGLNLTREKLQQQQQKKK